MIQHHSLLLHEVSVRRQRKWRCMSESLPLSSSSRLIILTRSHQHETYIRGSNDDVRESRCYHIDHLKKIMNSTIDHVYFCWFSLSAVASPRFVCLGFYIDTRTRTHINRRTEKRQRERIQQNKMKTMWLIAFALEDVGSPIDRMCFLRLKRNSRGRIDLFIK